MTEEVSIDAEKQLMRVDFGPRSTVKSWKNALATVNRLSEETGICRVLVDVRTQKKLAGTSTLFDFGANLPASIAFAVLCELHQKDHDFIETVAQNRGIPVQDFNSEQKAIEWLMDYPNKTVGDEKE